MGKSVKGTETEKNLLKSFAGESQARMRYTYFSAAAKKEGYVQIADIFEETANQEKEHAKRCATIYHTTNCTGGTNHEHRTGRASCP